MKSKEEEHISWVLEEFKDKKIVRSFSYEPEPFLLSEKLTAEALVLDRFDREKTKNKVLLQKHSYTCDFIIEWNPDYKGVVFSNLDRIEPAPFFISNYVKGKYLTYLEVKGEYDMENMTRLFKLNQKWVYEKFGIYVQLVKTYEFFRKYFIPKRYLLTDISEKNRKLNFFPLEIDEWLNSVKHGITQSNTGDRSEQAEDIC